VRVREKTKELLMMKKKKAKNLFFSVLSVCAERLFFPRSLSTNRDTPKEISRFPVCRPGSTAPENGKNAKEKKSFFFFFPPFRLREVVRSGVDG
jgi:hypothetical protein